MVKLRLYARAGVPEYWLVDIDAETVTVHRSLAGRDYADVRVASRGEVLGPLAVADLQVPVADLQVPVADLFA